MSKFVTEKISSKDREARSAINNAIAGKTDNTKDITFAIDVATTIITDHRIGADSKIFLMAKTANAALAYRFSYVSDVKKGQVTFTHPISSLTDRDFQMLIVG